MTQSQALNSKCHRLEYCEGFNLGLHNYPNTFSNKISYKDRQKSPLPKKAMVTEIVHL
jgi:hypothetical protein